MPFQSLPSALFNEFMGFIVKRNKENLMGGNLNAINVGLKDLWEYFREVCDNATINGASLIIKCGRDNYLININDLTAINEMAQNWLRRAYNIYISASDEYRSAVLYLIEKGNISGANYIQQMKRSSNSTP